MVKIGIYIFSRDLRLYDNLGLLKLYDNVDVIYPIFILDKNKIIRTHNNKYYFSNNAVQFICESLINLNKHIKSFKSYLRLFFGEPSKVIKKIISHFKTLNFNNIVIGYNKDFSDYAKKKYISLNNLGLHIITSDDDFTLISLKNVCISNKPVKHFGIYYKKVKQIKVNKPTHLKKFKFLSAKIRMRFEFNINKLIKLYDFNKNLAQRGGRDEGISKLKHLTHLKQYNDLRNKLYYQTSNISAYLNMGCLSVREIYYIFKHKLGSSNDIIKQLYWRDFYVQAFLLSPNGNKFQHIDNKFDKIKWRNSKTLWNILLNAKTGFLLIDSAITELKITGYLHNRARILLGSFWTKYLLINIFHPRYGSQVGFSRFLVDAIGQTQNKFNNQWLTEFDFAGRKYGPPLTGRPIDISNNAILKYDENCIYIKKWLPHLSHISNKDLILWDIMASKYKYIHPKPIFDPKIKYQEWIKACTTS
jgi:deoxyribodipyrimidine photo-lyase